jgi:hypothetical protein
MRSKEGKKTGNKGERIQLFHFKTSRSELKGEKIGPRESTNMGTRPSMVFGLNNE